MAALSAIQVACQEAVVIDIDKRHSSKTDGHTVVEFWIQQPAYVSSKTSPLERQRIHETASLSDPADAVPDLNIDTSRPAIESDLDTPPPNTPTPIHQAATPNEIVHFLDQIAMQLTEKMVIFCKALAETVPETSGFSLEHLKADRGIL